MKIYHNPRCSKSRQTLALIQDAGIEPEIIEYLKTPPSEAELDRILILLGIEPSGLMRKKEAAYKELDIANRQLTRQELIKVLTDNPTLIERPIVVTDDQAIIGRPPENVTQLLP
jgi:arsenate reductase (glutaredoxin)